MKHRPRTTFGTMNADVLAQFDPSFVRDDFVATIFNSNWPEYERPGNCHDEDFHHADLRGRATTHTADKESLRQDLQAVLGQLFDLHVQGVEAHAHFVGRDSQVFSDNSKPSFRRRARPAMPSPTYCANSTAMAPRGLIITEVPPAIPGLRPGERCTTAAVKMIAHRISIVLNTIRCVRNQLGDADTSAAALLGAIADAVDKQALMLASESQRIKSAT